MSDILVERCHRRFYLSPRAARGIVKRASKRGKEFPERLQRSLEALANEAPAE